MAWLRPESPQQGVRELLIVICLFCLFTEKPRRTPRMTDIALAFLWHQHQPYYPDDVAGENAMPWVRLHGVKDYYGMALHLLEFPEMRCTINLVPSLLRQLEAYTERG